MPFIVAVGTNNPVKHDAVRMGVSRYIDDPIEILGREVDSQVTNQPLGEDICMLGARNRAAAVLEYFRSENTFFDYAIGIESGLIFTAGVWFDKAAVVVINNKTGKVGIAWSSGVPVPAEIMEIVRGGKEMGPAVDEYLGVEGSNRTKTWHEYVSTNVLGRAESCSHGVIWALGSCNNPVFGTLQDISDQM